MEMGALLPLREVALMVATFGRHNRGCDCPPSSQFGSLLSLLKKVCHAVSWVKRGSISELRLYTVSLSLVHNHTLLNLRLPRIRHALNSGVTASEVSIELRGDLRVLVEKATVMGVVIPPFSGP